MWSRLWCPLLNHLCIQLWSLASIVSDFDLDNTRHVSRMLGGFRTPIGVNCWIFQLHELLLGNGENMKCSDYPSDYFLWWWVTNRTKNTRFTNIWIVTLRDIYRSYRNENSDIILYDTVISICVQKPIKIIQFKDANYHFIKMPSILWYLSNVK